MQQKASVLYREIRISATKSGLKNVAAFSNFGKNPETSQSEIEAFCQDQNNGYKALQTANKTDEESSVPETEEPIAKIETKVYPNPASNVVSVSIETDEEKEYTFQVYDLMGRVLINETLKGANQPLFEITTDQLANGTYLLRINSQDGAIAETHRIVILK
ncbi:T9SS type A sorting domain-containing protein [Oscillatoria amoena NRMC-F 0135]|nr:T9SS type A sorting domain-containing protein [Oscillatoria amoena NRMC-F 0135]